MFRDIKNDKLQFCSLKYGKKNFFAFDFYEDGVKNHNHKKKP